MSLVTFNAGALWDWMEMGLTASCWCRSCSDALCGAVEWVLRFPRSGVATVSASPAPIQSPHLHLLTWDWMEMGLTGCCWCRSCSDALCGAVEWVLRFPRSGVATVSASPAPIQSPRLHLLTFNGVKTESAFCSRALQHSFQPSYTLSLGIWDQNQSLFRSIEMQLEHIDRINKFTN